MCGLVGLLEGAASAGSDGELRERTRRMAGAIAHRGPDDEGVWTDARAGIALGHRRLSIVDLSPAGHQPMASRSGRYVLAFNGEIYNHGALRQELGAVPWRGHSDTEVLLEALDRWGLRETLDRSNGMFAIALWDRERQRLTLVRDRIGEKPLYWGVHGTTLRFASELAALRADPGWDAALDRDALTLLFRYKHIPAPYTVYRGVHKVMPGEMLTFEPGGREPSREVFWRPGPAGGAPFQGGPRDAVRALEDLLADAVALRMEADVPVGAFLSGGIDSTAVVAMMARQATHPVRTFTIAHEDARWDEGPAAEAIARALGTEHTTLRVAESDILGVVPELSRIFDEPFADSSQIPAVVVSRLARQNVTVVLSGDGGDELFGGYNRHTWIPRLWSRLGRVPRRVRGSGARALRAIPARWLDVLARGVPSRRRPRLIATKAEKLASTLECDGPEAMYLRLTSHWTAPASLVLGAREPTSLPADPTRWPQTGDLFDRLRTVDLQSYLPDDILVKLDRASMSVALEGRIPLLDHRIVEFALGLSRDVACHGGQPKWVLREIAARHVPRELLDRPKMGFGIPIGAWMRGPLRPWVDALLDPDRLRAEGVLDAGPVAALWAEHLSGSADHTYRLWDVVMFQAWYERWGPISG